MFSLNFPRLITDTYCWFTYAANGRTFVCRRNWRTFRYANGVYQIGVRTNTRTYGCRAAIARFRVFGTRTTK